MEKQPTFCKHVWFPAGSKRQACSNKGCRAWCRRDAQDKIVEYDSGVSVEER